MIPKMKSLKDKIYGAKPVEVKVGKKKTKKTKKK